MVPGVVMIWPGVSQVATLDDGGVAGQAGAKRGKQGPGQDGEADVEAPSVLPAERSGGEPGPVEPGDEAGLAQVFRAQGREAPFELTDLTIAPREFPQVRQQGRGRRR